MELENEIRELINCAVNGKYIGNLKIEKEEVEGDDPIWTLFLFLDRTMTPLILSYQGTEEKFKDFVFKEIKTRKLERVSFYRAEKIPFEQEENGYE